MKEKINLDVLCILRYKDNELIFDYEPIEINFSNEIDTLKKLCQLKSDNLIEIIKYLKETETIKILQKNYKYCKELDGSYQGFTVNFEDKISRIINTRDSFYQSAFNVEECNVVENIINLQEELEKEFVLWISAYNIEKTYRKCLEDKQILTFSHRINGWSNPEYKLSEHFTVELKTNFGYGSASYFFIKIKYKNIEITPFSEWVDYEIAKFTEINRYTKSFANRIFVGVFNGKRAFKRKIENSIWYDAMEFTKIACNISLKDEILFVRKYIIEECEKMVIGLEIIYSDSKFNFKGEANTHYKVDKAGHQLMEFRGEKISGALDFISKILDFNEIAEINSFIKRIEEVNRKIQPLLVQELDNIKLKLADLKKEMEGLKPEYEKFIEENKKYINLKNELKNKMVKSEELNLELIDWDKLHKNFLKMFPEFEDFEHQFNKVLEKYKNLTQKINNFNVIYKNINSYNHKILKYFEK